MAEEAQEDPLEDDILDLLAEEHLLLVEVVQDHQDLVLLHHHAEEHLLQNQNHQVPEEQTLKKDQEVLNMKEQIKDKKLRMEKIN